MQEQASKSSTKTETDEVTEVPTENKSEEVIEEANCCLTSIDEVLEENDNRELTDQEIVDNGHPYYEDYRLPNGDLDWDAYDAAEEKFHQAYSNVTGMEYSSCVCG